jgi:hypothetical protein
MIHLLPESSTVTEECSDGLLVLDLASLRYTFLDRTGAHMWAALRSSSHMDEVIDRLCAIYAADREVLRRDLLEYCDYLVAEGLAAREPHQRPTEAVADSSPTEDEPRLGLDWAAGLLSAAIRDGVAGDVVLLDAPSTAIATCQQVMARAEFDDLTWRLVLAAHEHAAAVQHRPWTDVCLLWIHTTDTDSLTSALASWLTRVRPGGYIVVSGLEPQVLVNSVATVAPPASEAVFATANGTEIVPVDWLTAWWKQR